MAVAYKCQAIRSISNQRKGALKMELFVAETQKFLMLTFCVSTILLAFSSLTLECKEEEAEALLGWKESLLQSHALQSWTSPPIPSSNSTPEMCRPCTWAGVTCDDAGNVMGISLSNASLKGSLHNFGFASFPNLIRLDLSCNSLFGTIPAEIGSLSTLSLLDLSHNRLSGPIPSTFGKLEYSLTHLYLSENPIGGPIPSQMGNLTHLAYLNISQTSISGTIPSELGNLKNLVQLCLYSNKLSGPIPPSLGNLTHLTHLYLYDNQLLGPIPQELGNLSSLIHLDLSKNNLSGSIPSSLGRLTKLTRLSLFQNQICGSIPLQIGNLKNLFQFLLYENRSSGVIQPQQIGNLENLYTGRATAPVDVAVVHRHLNQVDDYERAAPVGPGPVDDDEPHA